MRAVPTNRYLIFFSIASVGCLADLATKNWIFAKLGMPDPHMRQVAWIWEGVFGWQTSLNEGALFGIGQGQVHWFALLSCAALVALLVWLFVAGAARDLLLTVALGCVTAGILGNLYDRFGLPGLEWNYATNLHAVGEPVHAVRDWILVMIGPWHWPNFNIADSLLVCGAVLLGWHAFWMPGSKSQPQESGASETH
ncbi:MAG: signal peptidase II [Pirellulales bacterium]|nr:signal peptidase II [Pirellulales bacterium]